ncbi:MAG: hypothetical protein FWC91_10580 [Defluviitaleaceae bacterium]|nr:hypothetical protein [Defluviitaleaceae bacterium]
MFKSFKSKLTAMICVFLVVAAYPVSMATLSGANASFTSFSVDRTVVNAGQSVTFNATTFGASFVFASVGGQLIPGTMQGIDSATGLTTWLLTINPAQSQTVIVYANSANVVAGASIVSIPITVNGTEGFVSSTGQGVHHIYSITETEASQPNTVTLTIVTNAAPQFVWAHIGGGRYVQANRISQTASQATWEMSYRPPQYVAHTIEVSANHAYIIDETIVSQSFSVALAAPFVPLVSDASISRVTISPSTVDYRGRATITVRTNHEAEHVWAEVDGRRVNATRGSTTATLRNWTIEVRPDETQTITVYANTTNDTQGADTETVRVTVREEQPRITNLSLTRNSIRPGEWTTINITTNNEVEHVWANVDGTRRNASRESSTSNTRTWRIDIQPNNSQQITVYANRTNNNSGADSDRISVNVNNW